MVTKANKIAGKINYIVARRLIVDKLKETDTSKEKEKQKVRKTKNTSAKKV